MLDVALDDTTSAALAAMPERIRAALAAKAGALAAELQARIEQKLSGGVLNIRTGALVRAIGVTIAYSSTGVTARIATSPDVKYAAIHEFGGVISPHEIVPDKAKALAFAVGGKQAFAARVDLPAIRMPERSYMRSSLAEVAEKIKEELTTTVAEALR